MKKEQIAAHRKEVAKRLLKNRFMILDSAEVINNLLACTSSRKLIIDVAKMREEKLVEECTKQDVAMPVAFAFYNGKKFSIEFHFNRKSYEHFVMEYFIGERLSAKNFAERFAFWYSSFLDHLICRVSQGIFKKEEVSEAAAMKKIMQKFAEEPTKAA